jgi:hypothetical protein
MKIYKVEAERFITYHIAVEDGEDPKKIALDELEEAWDNEKPINSIFFGSMTEVDPYSKTLDVVEIYHTQYDLEELRELYFLNTPSRKPSPDQGELF